MVQEDFIVYFIVFGAIAFLIYNIVVSKREHWQIIQEAAQQTEQIRLQRSQDRQHEDSSSSSPPDRRTRRSLNGDLDCPICLNGADYAVETNCSHVFCTECIIRYHEISPSTSFGDHSIRCPCCRRRVTSLIRIWSPQELDALVAQLPYAVEWNHKLVEYNRKFEYHRDADEDGGVGVAHRSLFERIRDAPTLLRRLYRDATQSREAFQTLLVRSGIIVALLVSLLYLISPFDLLPESVLGIAGLFDDFMVLVTMGIWVANIYRSTRLRMQSEAPRRR